MTGKRVRKPRNSPKQLEERRRKYADRREHHRKARRDAHSALTEAERLERRWRQNAKPPRPRPGSRNSFHTRKVALWRSYRPWSDLEEVFRIYMAAAVMSELFGELYVVDHMVPLGGTLVCGLHTHDNLEVVRAAENVCKGNFLWPGMWPIEWDSLDLLLKAKQFA